MVLFGKKIKKKMNLMGLVTMLFKLGSTRKNLKLNKSKSLRVE